MTLPVQGNITQVTLVRKKWRHYIVIKKIYLLLESVTVAEDNAVDEDDIALKLEALS